MSPARRSHREPVITSEDVGKELGFVAIEAKKERATIHDGHHLVDIFIKIAKEQGYKVTYQATWINY